MITGVFSIQPQIFADERGSDPRSSAKICGWLISHSAFPQFTLESSLQIGASTVRTDFTMNFTKPI